MIWFHQTFILFIFSTAMVLDQRIKLYKTDKPTVYFIVIGSFGYYVKCEFHLPLNTLRMKISYNPIVELDLSILLSSFGYHWSISFLNWISFFFQWLLDKLTLN